MEEDGRRIGGGWEGGRSMGKWEDGRRMGEWEDGRRLRGWKEDGRMGGGWKDAVLSGDMGSHVERVGGGGRNSRTWDSGKGWQRTQELPDQSMGWALKKLHWLPPAPAADLLR